MANKTLFSSNKSRSPRASFRNEAGGIAYGLSEKHALAQLAATGTFNGTYYAQATAQLEDLTRLIDAVDDNVFLAKLAVYARERAFMKDMPAALIAVLSTRDPQLTHQVFERVVDNGRVLRTLFQMVRSGQFGRTGLSSSLKRAFQNWLNHASVGRLLSASIGQDPSLRDILRMARPRPKDNQRRALFGWLTDKPVTSWAPARERDLPAAVKALMAFRETNDPKKQVAAIAEQSIRWDLLAGTAIDTSVWKAIARQMGPQALRMNLNTLQRHGVLDDTTFALEIADRIADIDEVTRSRQFPYQYFAAYINASDSVPNVIRQALHRAAELACGNIPRMAAPIVIGLDTSGSMRSPATGYRTRSSTSSMKCVDVAALFAAAMLRVNPDSIVIPFDTRCYQADIDPGDTILSIAQRLAKYGGGGTNCALPLEYANQQLKRKTYGGCVLVSDNQSWIGRGHHGSTAVMTAWNAFVKNQQTKDLDPKMVCIDIQPYNTTQAPERDDILNIGGFSDSVFKVIAGFVTGDPDRFVSEIEAIELETTE